MMKELIYTSAPAGLRPGTSGFCTVGMSEGLSAAMVEFLERFSNTYRPVYMPYDPRAANNPVAVSLVRVKPAGQSFVVLSRNAAAGADHTGRTNNLAHHLIFESMGPSDGSNPAAVAAQVGTFRIRWNDSPHRLPNRNVPSSAGPRGVCVLWEETAGDAGWAGVVASAWIKQDNRPLYLIYPPGTDILSLISESISLLPSDRRWDATFTTYYTSLPVEATCIVRCVLAGTPQEVEARRGNYIDLLELSGPVPEGPLTERARGRAVVDDLVPALSARAVPKTPLSSRNIPDQSLPMDTDNLDADFDEPPPVAPPPPRRRAVQEPRPVEAVVPPAPRWGGILAIVLGLMFLLSTGVGAVVGLMQHGARKEAEEQRDQARLDKAETDKRLQATEQQIQTLKDDLGRALARSTPSHVEVPKVEIPEKIKPVAPRPPSDWRWIWDPAKPKPPKGKTEPGPVVKKSNEPETPPLPKKRNPSETDYDEWFGELAGLNFAERWVRYKRLNDDDFVKKAGKNVDSFELILKDLPGKDLEKKSEQKVFWIKSASFREAPKEANYTIIARYLSGTQSGRGKGGTPTYVPEKGQRIMEIKPPIKIKHVVNPSADLLERQFYYVEQADFPFEVSDDANLIFVVEKNVPTQPSECLLMWLRKKQKS